MAQSVIGSLRVNLGLDSAQFQRGARKMDRPLQNMKKQFMAIAVVAGGMGAAITAAAISGAKQIDETAKSARRLDASIGGFRALELAASEAGVSLSSLTNDIQTMNREIASIGVSGNGLRALEALGLSVEKLEGLDADEKLALIADQVKALGLDAGQTTAILRDLGVRNREMALLVLQGGDAIRDARTDIEEYGLAISSVDADRIEKANDAMGRLGLITQYVGQQLAIALVPAMGRLAEAMTDSLREGGLLRAVIDGLTENIDVLAYSAGVAVTAFGVRYVGALVASKIATFSLVGALATLKAALISTGIGALVVGAGYLIAKFADLSSAAGGFGNAMVLLKSVALEVFDRIKISFAVIPAAIRSGSARMNANFVSAIGTMASKFVEFTWTVAEGLNSLFGSNLQGASAEITQELNRTAIAAENTASAAAASMNKLAASAAAPIKSLEALRGVMSEAEDASEEASDGAKELSEELDGLSNSAGGAAGSLAKTAATASETASEFNNNLTSAVNGVADAFAEWTVNGFQDFKTMTGSIFDAFKNMLKRMIATAASNKIMVSLGIGGGAAGGMAGGGGLLSSVLGGSGGLLGGVGGLGGLGSAFMGGASFLGSGIASGFASGGLAGAFSGGASALGTALSGATMGLGGAAAALGAAIPVIGAVALAFSAFKKKTKVLDSGIGVAIDGMDVAVNSFEKIETSRFFGLSKRKRTKTKAIADSPIADAVSDIQMSVMDAAEVLGIGADAFEGFSTKFKVSLKGLSEEAAQQAILGALEGVGDSMAGSISGLNGFKKVGEGSLEALQRLSASLSTVNDAFKDLGFSLYNVSLAGADGASQFADLFGGLQQFTSASGAYYQAFYSEQERLENATNRLGEALGNLGINVLPTTNAAFRELVDTAMLAGDSSLAAELIQLAPAFDSVTNAAASLRSELLNVDENAFATGVDYRRGLSRAANGIEYTPGQREAEMVAEIKALRSDMALLQSTSEITAANTGKAADNTEGSLFLAEESLL